MTRDLDPALGAEQGYDPSDLEQLCTDTQNWLERNTPLVSTAVGGDPAIIHGYVEGVPLTEAMLHHSFRANGDIVREIAPTAARVLRIGPEVEVSYLRPHYEPRGDGPEGPYHYLSESWDYSVKRQVGVREISESLIVRPGADEDEAELVCERITDTLHGINGGPISPFELATALGDGSLRLRYEGDATAEMTEDERKAWREIVDKLDLLQAAQVGGEQAA